jgi:hypothetical protein
MVKLKNGILSFVFVSYTTQSVFFGWFKIPLIRICSESLGTTERGAWKEYM